MAQTFARSADTYLRLALLVAAILIVGGLSVAGGVVRSDWITAIGKSPYQPVPFSHKHHAGQLGIDCRYCHTTVEVAESAGYPPTYTCMTCHSQIWTGAPVLEPVRLSLAENEAIPWIRVHDLPDFVYFNHAIHVSRGVDCEVCHGRVEAMDMLYKAEPMTMQWCLACHRQPRETARERGGSLPPAFHPPTDPEDVAGPLLEALDVPVGNLDHCYICHR